MVLAEADQPPREVQHRFVGAVPSAEVPGYLARADLMIFPAQGEGFGDLARDSGVFVEVLQRRLRNRRRWIAGASSAPACGSCAQARASPGVISALQTKREVAKRADWASRHRSTRSRTRCRRARIERRRAVLSCAGEPVARFVFLRF